MCQLAISQPGSKAPFAMFHMNVSFSCLSPLSAVCQMSTGDGLWPACQHAALLFCSLYWTTIAEACSRFARVCVCVCASSLQERRVIILQFSHFSIYLQWLSLCNSDCIFVHGIWIYMIIYICVWNMNVAWVFCLLYDFTQLCTSEAEWAWGVWKQKPCCLSADASVSTSSVGNEVKLKSGRHWLGGSIPSQHDRGNFVVEPSAELLHTAVSSLPSATAFINSAGAPPPCLQYKYLVRLQHL